MGLKGSLTTHSRAGHCGVLPHPASRPLSILQACIPGQRCPCFQDGCGDCCHQSHQQGLAYCLWAPEFLTQGRHPSSVP